ncbi:hypothetical protein [Hyphomicrobium sp. ghe19]|uniref:hypothetical protein n=1 Tax=Hyphomicrobium sp. ghe19 TaxID=2682968 RepID=UPI0013675581|nr:hypothetical protein HYPP_03828 [Hyphomicrobium sp. ghe19]
MKLGAWIKKEKLTLAAFGDRIGRHVSAVQRYAAGRIPNRETMVDIYVDTRGEVMPNDFYDLPELETEPAVVSEPSALEAA